MAPELIQVPGVLPKSGGGDKKLREIRKNCTVGSRVKVRHLNWEPFEARDF